MSGESDTAAAFGLSGTTGWLVGGALGGAIGAIAFGILLVLLDPDVLSSAIPAIYGIEPNDPFGWAIHIAHGIVLGVIFGLLVTRAPILGVIRTGAETGALSETGVVLRTTGAGLVYGLAVWTVLPLIVLPVWITTVGVGEQSFPATAATSLLGHVLFGIVLGAVFAVTVDLHHRPTDKRLES